MWRRLVRKRKKIMHRCNINLNFNSVFFKQEQKGAKYVTLQILFTIFDHKFIGQGLENDILM